MANPSHSESADPIAAHAGQPAPHDAHAPNPVEVSAPMMGFTWLTFGLLALVLYKVAWKPILDALDRREQQIRTAMEEAEKTRTAYAEIETRRQQLIDEADAKARAIIEQARKGAVETAQTIEAKARDEAGILLANAQREIAIAGEKALADLRRESADLAVGLTRKILADQLDENRGRALVDRMLKQV